MKILGLNHITFLCKDIEKSSRIFIDLFEAKEVYSSEEQTFSLSKEKFFLMGDLWIAIMEGSEVFPSYNHIAFSVREEDLTFFAAKIKELELKELPGRTRSSEEGKSIYFYDYDNHLFELHTGNLTTRLRYYEQTSPLLKEKE